MAVVTDSTSSLDPERAALAGVTVIPLQVVIDGHSRPETEVPPHQVADALRAGSRVSTSRPTPEVIAAAYADLAAAGHTAIVSVHLSERISGTVGAAEIAAAGTPIPVTVIDSRTVGMAVGFAALAGAARAAGGASTDDVAALIRARTAGSNLYFCPVTLEYLRRGGRIGAAAALLGSALSVKPLLSVEEGEIRVSERVRTTSKARARLEELSLAALARAAGQADVDVAVHHLDAAEPAARLAERMAGRLSGSEVVVAELSAVLGVHVGPGTLGVVIAPRFG